MRTSGAMQLVFSSYFIFLFLVFYFLFLISYFLFSRNKLILDMIINDQDYSLQMVVTVPQFKHSSRM